MSKERMPKILWVENDTQQIQHYISALGDNGFSVTLAKTTSEAKRALKSNPDIDFAILDVMIPPADDEQDLEETQGGFIAGLTLARWIRQNFPELPFMGFSIRVDKEIQDWFQRYGAGFVSKMSVRDVRTFMSFIRNRMNSKWVTSEIEDNQTDNFLMVNAKEKKNDVQESSDSLQIRLKELEYEYELARMGLLKSQWSTVFGVVGGLLTILMAFLSNLFSEKQFLSGTHIVLIVITIAFALIAFSSFIFGRATRLKAEISKTKKQIEMVTGEKVR